MTTPAASFDAAPAAPGKAPALWEDLIDVFTSPVAVFARRRDGRFWLAMLVFTLLGAVGFAAARPTMQPLFDRQVAVQDAKLDANPQLSPEAREKAKAQIRSMMQSPFAMAAGVVALPGTLLAGALALWLIGKAFGSGASYAQALAVTSLAGIPRIVLGLLTAAGGVAMGRQVEFPHQLTLGPGTVLGDVGPVAGALLQRLDVGILWQTALMGVGLALMGRLVRRGDGPAVEGQISRGAGLAAAAAVWLLATLLAVWQGYMQTLA
jgi:hypothetical protein